MLTLNAAMVLSVPVDGAHYFIDVPAGGAVAATGIWIARGGCSSWRRDGSRVLSRDRQRRISRARPK
jgi:membrane-associated phospholipid phosphatase